jgi:hypothetical protein
MCKFKGIKDSQGECYTRGEGPPTPALARKKHRRAYPIDYDELVTREVLRLELDRLTPSLRTGILLATARPAVAYWNERRQCKIFCLSYIS